MEGKAIAKSGGLTWCFDRSFTRCNSIDHRVESSHELKTAVNIVYVIESAAYGVICTSCLCQKPERARYELVRAFDTNNECIQPRTKHFL